MCTRSHEAGSGQDLGCAKGAYGLLRVTVTELLFLRVPTHVQPQGREPLSDEPFMCAIGDLDLFDVKEIPGNKVISICLRRNMPMPLIFISLSGYALRMSPTVRIPDLARIVITFGGSSPSSSISTSKVEASNTWRALFRAVKSLMAQYLNLTTSASSALVVAKRNIQACFWQTVLEERCREESVCAIPAPTRGQGRRHSCLPATHAAATL